mmetsp:Transcript_37338/g.60692  ORF Transcript_37338/g.60692 Transcript_37338/m.60692 type:complete len:113 (-) Transcript_37338:329-667(-)
MFGKAKICKHNWRIPGFSSKHDVVRFQITVYDLNDYYNKDRQCSHYKIFTPMLCKYLSVWETSFVTRAACLSSKCFWLTILLNRSPPRRNSSSMYTAEVVLCTATNLQQLGC